MTPPPVGGGGERSQTGKEPVKGEYEASSHAGDRSLKLLWALRSSGDMNLRVTPHWGARELWHLYSCSHLPFIEGSPGHCAFLGTSDWAPSKRVLAAPESPQAKTYRCWHLSQHALNDKAQGGMSWAAVTIRVIPKNYLTNCLAGQPLFGIL